MYRLLALMLIGIGLISSPAPAEASEAYRKYAERLLAKLPAGAVVRPDLEAELNALASAARTRAGKAPLTASPLLVKAARAQALEMLIGKYVGHRSAGGFRYVQRFEAFGGPDRGDHGENAARDRKRGPVDGAKARRLFRQWLDSGGHRRNLMKRWYNYVSTGAVQIGHHLYAVQIFWEK